MSQSAFPSRRQFLQTSAAAASALTLPYFVPKTAFGANDRIHTGHIGVGRQGNARLGEAMAHAIAVCDVDQGHAAAAAKRVQTKNGKCDVYGDYRELLERKDIDAVVIATPDHWHAKTMIDACQAGKDVFCEKPLSLTIAEGRKMVEAARANKCVTQTGSQQRSSENFRYACELVRSGRIGKLQTVLVGLPGPNHPGKLDPDTDPPAGLNYDMWLGPAPDRPYNVKRVHYNFRFWWDYSGGQMTNFGAHHIDIAQWGIGADDSGPVEISGEATFHPDGYHEVTETCRITYKYANGVEMIVGQKQKDIPGGTVFIGDKGRIEVDRGKLVSKPDDIIKQPIGEGDVHLYKVAKNGAHMGNFFDCVKSREKAVCDVEIGHRSATCCHLGNISVRLGRKIQWDPVAEKIVDDSQADAMCSRPYRAPWVL